MPTLLLQTKLYRPAVLPRRVSRPRLLTRLNEGLAAGRGITLVSAPAGFGKTSCVSEWVETLDRPVAWLSLDAADDDPARFFAYLIAALQKVDSGVGREIESVLRGGQFPPADIISTILCNDLLESGKACVLVLDDFQVIQDRFILQVMDHLVSNAPPRLHLVLITREDPALPFARLRANNRMTEVRAADLRLTRPEIDLFLGEVMGLVLSSPDIEILAERTEGWVVGLQLAGLSLRDRADPSSLIATLSGSHRYILSYLTEQVLNGQSQELQQFLLQTSILDTLNGDLCNAVTGRGDSEQVLERLCAANLFLVPLDDAHRWYRYHHLFADLLRDLLSARESETGELHLRASRWYATAGMADEAVQHALAASDYGAAVQLLESHAMDLLMQWHVKTVERWMKALPPEWSTSPRTNLAFAWMHLMRRNVPEAVPYIERLEKIFANPETADAALQAEWLALQEMLLIWQGQATEGIALANRALALTGEKDLRVRTLIYNGLAAAYQQMGDDTQAVDAYRMIAEYGRAAGDFVYEVLGLAGMSLVMIFSGRFHAAFDLATQARERIERSGSLPPIAEGVYGELGQLYYQWNQLEQAYEYFKRSVEVSKLSGYPDAEIYYDVARSRLFELEGKLEAAAEAIQQAVDLMRTDAPATVGQEVPSQLVRVLVAQGRLEAAEAVLAREGFDHRQELAQAALTRPITPQVGPLYNSALRVLLYRGRERNDRESLASGVALAGRVIDAALERQYMPLALETLLLRARLHSARGEQAAALADCARVVETAEPEGYIALFLEQGPEMVSLLRTVARQADTPDNLRRYIDRLVAAFGAAGAADGLTVQAPAAPARVAATPTLVEPLSARELEILRLIATGSSNQEIAERLVISLNTVKKHNSNIMSKLAVKSRTQAVARARELQLV